MGRLLSDSFRNTSFDVALLRLHSVLRKSSRKPPARNLSAFVFNRHNSLVIQAPSKTKGFAFLLRVCAALNGWSVTRSRFFVFNRHISLVIQAPSKTKGFAFLFRVCAALNGWSATRSRFRLQQAYFPCYPSPFKDERLCIFVTRLRIP